ncbi:MAG: hypothetical protein Q4D85_04560 [Corynebacterium sp.]|uniref:hypothetical protein n=1 Tax=Corynebacterium sp. TaxID=1720 RepID=UPI0026DA86E0|nr:hypothetical protein [Corynebacterium sp.]MDO5098010.1 hypothetical protein [Corynebacterium sp.]
MVAGHSLGDSAAFAVGEERLKSVRAAVSLNAHFVHNIAGLSGDQVVFDDSEYPIPVLRFYSEAGYQSMAEKTTCGTNYATMKSGNPKFVDKHVVGTGHAGVTNGLDGGRLTRHPPKTLA